MTVRAEVAGELNCELGESPLWDPDRGELLWLDITGRQLHRLDAEDGAVRSVARPATATAIGLTDGFELVAATATGFGRVDPDTGVVQSDSPSIVENPDDRMNDGAVAPDGSFWAGSCVAAERSGSASLWRWRGQAAPELMLDGLTISNGMDWLSGDITTMLYVDSASRGIDRLTFDEAGTVVERRRIADVDPGDGEPDGLCLDEQGRAWVAIWGGSEVRAYDAEGRLEDVIPLPVRNPSSCAFGGGDRRTLYITSAREDLVEPGVLDGRLLACRLPVCGPAPRRFFGAPVPGPE